MSELAGLAKDLGVIDSKNRGAELAKRPDCIMHCAMTDDRMFEAIDDLSELVQAGINVVSSGPVLLQFPFMTSALDMVAELPDLREQMETRTPLGRIGETDDIAAAVLYLACRRVPT